MTIKILNLYAGIGGNRKLWDRDIEVTAVENNQEIADIYKTFFPNDKIVVADAHEYLLNHFDEFDFIWSSPPCPSHSKIRIYTAVTRGQNKPIFPDMKLYEEIIFLQYYFKGKFVVENVISFYDPLIKPTELNNHYFWSNFDISQIKNKPREHDAKINVLEKRKGFDLSGFKLQEDKKKILRNCVEPETGLHIFECAFHKKQLDLNNYEVIK
jgi:DNA (cytosine-5)-methyltransferase 1